MNFWNSKTSDLGILVDSCINYASNYWKEITTLPCQALLGF